MARGGTIFLFKGGRGEAASRSHPVTSWPDRPPAQGPALPARLSCCTSARPATGSVEHTALSWNRPPQVDFVEKNFSSKTLHAMS